MDAVFECLDKLNWVRWEDKVWWADGPCLKEPEKASFLVSKMLGLWIGERKFRSLLRIYLRGGVKKNHLNIRDERTERIVVLRPTPSFHEIDNLSGLWYPVVSPQYPRFLLYFVPPKGDLKVLIEDSWPKGMYCLNEWGAGQERNFDPSGTIEDLFAYWRILAQDVEEGWELSLALVLPALFRQGRVMFMIMGGSAYEQEVFMSRVSRLIGWNQFPAYSKSAYKQARSLRSQSIIRINRFNRRLATDKEWSRLVKLTLDGTGVLVRRPRTDLVVDKFSLSAPVFICSAGIKVHERLATRSLRIHLRDTGLPPSFPNKDLLQPKALMGAFRLFQWASHVVPPENLGNLTPYVDWAHWAYCYAKVLGVEERFLAYLKQADEYQT